MLINSIVLVLVIVIVGVLSYILGSIVAGLYWRDKLLEGRKKTNDELYKALMEALNDVEKDLEKMQKRKEESLK